MNTISQLAKTSFLDQKLMMQLMAKIQKLYMTVRAKHDVFNERYIKHDGIKYLMVMIEDCQDHENHEFIQVCI